MSRKPIYEDKTPEIFKTTEFKELKDKWNKKLNIQEEPRRLNKEFIVSTKRSTDDEDESTGIEKFSNEDMLRWPKGINSKYEELQHFWPFENETEEKIIFLYITYHIMYKRIAEEVGVSVNRVRNVVRRVMRQMKKHASK
jgi:hypothetical protein